MSSLVPPESYADQEQEARQLIDTIRVKHSTVAHKELEQIIDSLLHLTSSELYDNSTHCILELLQNADDNHYHEGVLPTLTFTYEPGGLRVDCNERGFKAKHVEAISTVRHSTKSGKKHSHGYTGEKGIGFKSIYRIADEVWISSRQYRFKFDKHEKFGMIAPVWADFPKQVIPDHTSFFLKLANGCDQQDLIKELKSFEPQLLLFLRRIRRVRVKVREESGTEWSQNIHKTTKMDRNNTITTLDTGCSQQRFVTFEHVVDNLPSEPRRLCISSSALDFALPITTLPDEPLSGRQQVFALLPISDYGLQFLLNGDFILSASRSNIDESLPWNQRLRDGLADGFLAAVDHFNGGHLKYFWPFYIPNKDVSAFFLPARDLILSRLRSESILESTASSMAQPSSLVYVNPDRYADSSGRPFTLCPETEKKYLSTEYPKWTVESVLALGVSEMSDAEFLDDLKRMIDSNKTLFETHDGKWHQELSKALLPLTRNEDLKEGLMHLAIISLCDGKWTSAQQKPVFFGNDLDPAKFPGSIELSIVGADVSRDYSRRTLLQALEIAEIDSTRLCRHIADAHASKSFRPETFSRAELISHAAYLFKSSWQPPDWVRVDLWFATSDGGRCRGSETYVQGDCEVDSAMARVFNKLRKKFSSVHDNYFLGPASGDVVRLADSIESPFATYSALHLYSPLIGLIKNVDEDFVVDQAAALQEIGDVELVFDLYHDILAEDDRNNRTLLLTKSPSPEDKSKHAAPAARLLHGHYFPWGNPFDDDAPIRGRYSGKTGDSESNARESWRLYMIKTLHVSDIPRLVSRHNGTSKRKFKLSNEFRFLFKECPVTDVLQLINEHWTAYTEWLELSATQQRSAEAIASNNALMAEIGATKVMHNGASVLIRDLVLPDLDTFVNNLEIPIPILEMENHQDSTLRRRLACFGIAVTNDLHYYLVCLQAVSNQAFPEHDTLAYLYEQVQVRYMTDENAIYSAFEDLPLIYAGRLDTKNSSPLWLTIGQAKGRLRAISGLYPDCKDLFTWLLSTSTDDLSALIRHATTIDVSWPLHEIASVLILISNSLSTMSFTKAKVAAKPLGSRAIFPVCDGQQQIAYDHLVSAQDETWFIADDAVFERSFRGVVTRLAFTGSEFRALQSLLSALSLYSRQLSKLCTRKVFPSGTIRYSARDTRFFQSIAALFIKDLIPQNNPDRNKLGLQLVNAIVMVASEILERQIFRFKDGPEHVGQAVAGKIALRVDSGGKDMRIFIARKDSIYQRRAFPLISMIAEHCGIKDSLSLRLLGAALSDSSINRVHSAFADAGYAGHDRRSGGYDSDAVTGQRHARSGDVFRISSILSDSDYDSDSEEDSDRAHKSGSRSTYRSRESRPRKRYGRGRDPEASDPRLPLLSFSKVGLEQPVNPIDAQGKFLIVQTMDPNRHLEYYGERLVSEMLKMELKDAYNPRIHWTSSLRTRAGLSLLSDSEDSSPFTLRDLEASKAISRFLLQHGHDMAIYWRMSYPTFHVELAITSSDSGDSFIWSTAQLRRIQNHRLRWNDHKADKNVMLLLHISNVYSKPAFRVFIDPWDLVISNRLIIHGNTKFRATIDEFAPADELLLAKNGARKQSKPHWMPNITSTTGSCPQTKSWSVAITAFSHPYKYLPLSKNQLRLFLLFPGKKTEPICGMIFTVSCTEDAGSLCIKEAGNYRALSYEWGDRKKERLIYTESGTLKIWGSLHNAIMALREEKSAAILWIDAVCINQTDDKEKIRQIRLLPQIFQQASRTLAFMGSDSRSNGAIETLLQIRAKLDGSETWPKGLKKVPLSWEHRPKPSSDDPIWQDIKFFFERTWFKRAWIVQEAVAAPTVTVVCGKWMVDWEDLHLAMEVVEQEPRLPDDITASWAPFSTLSSLRDWEARQRRFDLFTLLDTFHYMNSTLKRDHFFALLGLAEDGNEEDFTPQYGGIDFASIACRYGRAFVKQGKGVHLLHRAGTAGRSVEEQIRFPSWLPDFTTRPRDRLIDLHDRGMVFNASKGMEEDIDCEFGDTLIVRGCIVDEIIEVGKHSNGRGPKQWVKYFAEIDDIIDDVLGGTDLEHKDNLKVQVPIAGALSVGEFTIEESYAAFRQGLRKARFKSAKQLKLRDTKAQIFDTPNSVHGGVMTVQERGKQYESLLRKNIAGWRFIVTKRKRFGVAPNGVKVGDMISIIGGGDVPFILRGSWGHMEFSLVAGCYIYGIMNGEALKFPDVREDYFLIN